MDKLLFWKDLLTFKTYTNIFDNISITILMLEILLIQNGSSDNSVNKKVRGKGKYVFDLFPIS